MQAALVVDGDGALEVQTAPILENEAGRNEEWLAHPLGVALLQRNVEEDFTLRCEVSLGSQDGVRKLDLTGCERTICSDYL